jgi:hypothetical protein
MRNQPLFEFLFTWVQTDPLVSHDGPMTQDLLYVALSKANEPAIDLLLKNETIRRRAKERNYYSPAFSGSIRSKIERMERPDSKTGSARPSFWGTDLSPIAPPDPQKSVDSTAAMRKRYV